MPPQALHRTDQVTSFDPGTEPTRTMTWRSPRTCPAMSLILVIGGAPFGLAPLMVVDRLSVRDVASVPFGWPSVTSTINNSHQLPMVSRVEMEVSGRVVDLHCAGANIVASLVGVVWVMVSGAVTSARWCVSVTSSDALLQAINVTAVHSIV